MKHSRIGIPTLSLLFLGIVLSVSYLVKTSQPPEKAEIKETKIEHNTPVFIVQENKSVYSQDKDDAVDVFNVSILPPEGTYKNLQFINENVNYSTDNFNKDIYDPKANVVLRVNDKEYRGTLELRGQSSRLEPQKSYKIKLFDNQASFAGLRVLNLNKHLRDKSRVRNKLAYDIIEDIDGLTGLRTRFVHLYITEAGITKDYGLYTLVEQPNKAFLRAHELDDDGQLYKAEFFEFLRYEGVIEEETNPGYSEEEFNQHLEIKENPQLKKLIQMLDDVNNPQDNINKVIEGHFNKDNLLTWLALNILLDNHDSNSRNYILYAPAFLNQYYFINWDMDKTMREKEKDDWSYGLSNYWGCKIFNRYFRDPNNVTALTQKIEELYPLLTPEKMNQRLEIYRPVVYDHMLNSVDYEHYKKFTLSENFRDSAVIKKFWEGYYGLALSPTENRSRFYRNLENPYPYFIQYSKEEKHRFSWDMAFDMQGDAVIYTLKISSDLEFNTVLFEKQTSELNLTLDEVPVEGKYWTVIARDSKGNEQIPFNLVTENGVVYRGVEKLEVK